MCAEGCEGVHLSNSLSLLFFQIDGAVKLILIVNHNNLDGCTSTLFSNIGPSGVCALPSAAGINVGGHYKGHFFSLSLSGSLLNLPEDVIVGFQIFAWAPK